MNNIIKRTWKQNTIVNIEDLRGMTFQAESGAHTFEISAVDADNNPITLSGTPSGTMLRPDNTDQALTCSISGGKLYATLPAGCYDVPGRAGITIFLTSDSQKTALYAAVVSVSRTQSGTAAPGTTASVVDLINAINAAISQIPASDANLKAAMAPTYSGTALYSVGQCAWDGGVLYECTVPITEAENPRVAAHWKTADLSESIRSLKNDLSNAPFAGKEFIVPAGTEHSATKDQLLVNIKAGEKYIILFYGNGIINSYRKDGTRIAENVPKYGVASEDIAAFGVYTNNLNGAEAITNRILVAYNPMGMDIYDSISFDDFRLRYGGNNLINYLDENDPDYLKGKGYSSTTSTIIDSSGCNISGYIYLPIGWKIIINYLLPQSAYAIKYAVYNENKVWVSTNIVSTGVVGEDNSVEYTATKSCYVRVQYWDVNTPVSINIQGLYRIKKEAVDDAFVLNDFFNWYLSNNYVNFFDKNDPDFLKDHGYSYTTGTIVEVSGVNISGYIPFSNGYIPTIKCTSLYGMKIAEYNTSKQWEKTTSYSSTGTELTYIPKNQGGYIRIQFASSNEPINVNIDGLKKIKQNFVEGQGDNVLKYNVSQFSGKKWTSFGDSITFQNKWQPPIVEMLGLVHTNCGIGSTSLCGPSFSSSLLSYWTNTRLSAVKTSNPDIVTILGGSNDAAQPSITLGDENEFNRKMPTDAEASESATEYDPTGSYSVGDYCKKDSVLYECKSAISDGETWNPAHWDAVKNVDTFIGAYSYIIEYLLSWKPTLDIVIMGQFFAHNDAVSLASGITYTQFSEAARTVAKHYGLPFVDLHGDSGFNKFTMGDGSYAVYSSDHIHPNDAGAKRITKLVLDVFVNKLTVN